MIPIGGPRSGPDGPQGEFDTVTIGVPTGEIPVAQPSSPVDDEIVIPARPALPRRVLGVGALAFAILTGGATALAISRATGGEFEVATVLAWTAIAASVLAVIAGLIAIVTARGRVFGVAAVVVALVANPFLLRAILAFLGEPAAA